MHHPDIQGTPSRCPVSGNVELYGKGFGADPEAHYAYLRSLGPSAPVDIAPGVEVELITSYDAALAILHDTATFVRDSRRWNALNEGRVPEDSPALPMMGYRPNALFSDGAAHARLRQAVTDSLAAVDELQLVRQTKQSAEYLISQFSSDRGGRAELMAEYANQLPLLVFSDLFGCPPEIGDRVIVGITGIFDGTPDADQVLAEALSELIALKHRRPGPDVTTRLMQHSAQLTDEEVLHQLVTLLSGGTTPLAAAIGTSSALILDESWQPGLPVESAVSQALWNYAPIANYATHYPTRDVELGERIIKANDPVVISFAAANTDPRIAQHNEQLGSKAHIAFGAGPHACPAKDPAFLVAVTAVECLLNQLPDVEVCTPFDALEWAPTPWSRTLATLPVSFTPSIPDIGGGAAEQRPSAPVPEQVPMPAQRQETGKAEKKGGLFSRFLAWTRGE
ncbi:cytochrome P450 [Streptomyces cacaoi]|uniref:Cytochrome P450 n=1 Tax=Streptomyces cacaoi TaxID=1898 RepID=A0A4Y3R8Z6_STRCI|nr:cytochrome P450 [Streptomyces cacaoi]NNG83812.1 cytochrome P450 [Streptomyces cacaoi]GEB54146.1 cytochrome P450 [Streptomyces cacaoi]